MVLDLAGRAAQKTWLKLQNHEHFFWHFVFAAYAKARRRRKPEPRVVGRMAQNNDGAEAELFALFEGGSYKCRPDALALMTRGDGHGCETHDP